MKRSWNWPLWVGFPIVLLGVVSYPMYFVRFPALRDFPWANLAIIALGLILTVLGLARAFRQPTLYRGKVFGSVLGLLALATAALFCYGIFIGAKHILPASPHAPQVGQLAPDFTLPDSQNHPVNLAQTLAAPFRPSAANSPAAGQTAGVILIFYRGYW
jgi:hypothetical protein